MLTMLVRALHNRPQVDESRMEIGCNSNFSHSDNLATLLKIAPIHNQGSVQSDWVLINSH